MSKNTSVHKKASIITPKVKVRVKRDTPKESEITNPTKQSKNSGSIGSVNTRGLNQTGSQTSKGSNYV